MSCRTADRGKGKKSVKEVLLELNCFFIFLDRLFRTQKFEKYKMLNYNIFNWSQTLLAFLSSISNKFNFSLSNAMIGSIVDSTNLSKSTMLEIGLGLVA